MLVPERIKVMSTGSKVGAEDRRWVASIGSGNIGYVIFVLSLIVGTVTLSMFGGEHVGEEYGGLFLAVAILFWLVSFIFFTVNVVWAIAALIRGRSAAKPLIGCAMPILVVAVPWLWSWLNLPVPRI